MKSLKEFLEVMENLSKCSCDPIQSCIQCGGCCREPCGLGWKENEEDEYCVFLVERDGKKLCKLVLEDTTGWIESGLGIGKGCVGRYWRKERR